MDGVVCRPPIEMGKLGGAASQPRSLWTRYEDPDAVLSDASARRKDPAHGRSTGADQQFDPRASRISRAASSVASVTPARRGVEVRAQPSSTSVIGHRLSAEHVSKTVEPLNLKKFIREIDIPVIVGGCASYSTALHLMRTGAVGVLVGVGPGHACTSRGVLGIGVPQATAIADAAGARIRHLDETGVYVHVIADGGMRRWRHRQGLRRSAVMIGSPLPPHARRRSLPSMYTFHRCPVARAAGSRASCRDLGPRTR
jgi:IMP dehydrogenase